MEAKDLAPGMLVRIRREGKARLGRVHTVEAARFLLQRITCQRTGMDGAFFWARYDEIEDVFQDRYNL